MPNLPGKKWFLIVLGIAILDQITKWCVLKKIAFHQIKPIFPGFNVTLSYNRGIAFSWFHQNPAWGNALLLVGVLIIIGIIATWLLRTPSTEKLEGLSLSFILGGAVGNVIDRLWHGHVIDFIDVYVKQWHFYTFNVADAFISIGAAFLILGLFKKEGNH